VYVTAQLLCDGRPLPGGARTRHVTQPLPLRRSDTNDDVAPASLPAPLVRSSARDVSPQRGSASWSESSPLALAWRVRDLPRTAVLALAAYAAPCCAEAVAQQDLLLGAAQLRLFSKTGRRLKAGRYTLRLVKGTNEDDDCPRHDAPPRPFSSGSHLTEGVSERCVARAGAPGARAALLECERSLRRYGRPGEWPRLPWLDALALPALAQALARALARCRAAGDVMLTVTLPGFSAAVVHSEPTGGGGGALTASQVIPPAEGPPRSPAYATQVAWFADAGAAAREDPCARRASKLARAASSVLRGAAEADRHAVPTGPQRRQLAALLRSPASVRADQASRDMLWAFRHALRSDPAALAPFLAAVDWADAAEASCAEDLLDGWAPLQSAPDALELLSPAFADSPAVRAHATRHLARCGDDALADILLQLVQALRFEGHAEESAGDREGVGEPYGSPLEELLVSRGASSLQLATGLHWYLWVACLDGCAFGGRARATHARLLSACPERLRAQLVQQSKLVGQLEALSCELASVRGHARKRERLQALLAPGGAAQGLLSLQGVPCPLDPQLALSAVLPSHASVFKSALAPLRLTFAVLPRSPPTAPLPPEHEPPSLVHERLDSGAASSQGSSPEDASLLAGAMAGLEGLGRAAANAASVAAHTACSAAGLLPMHAVGVSSPLGSVRIGGSGGGGRGESCAGAPQAGPPATVTLIYKKGDDLRQDQLCVQLFDLMDTVLRRDGLDLRMTRYAVLATGPDSGLVAYVPSCTCSAVLAEHRTILRYFAFVAPDSSAPNGVRPAVFETFLRSCAAACVATYILGVGDRHLDNLMLTPDGRLFHIDFGYILGRDPKLFPPPMKLCREMVEAMGGMESAGYARFQTLACEAFNILRKSASLLLTRVAMMARAGIADLGNDACAKLEEKLALQLGDEEAVGYFAGVMNDSAGALFEGLKENAHRIAQYLR